MLEPVDGFLVKNALILKCTIFSEKKKTETPAFSAPHTSTNALQCRLHGRYDIIVSTAAELYLCALCSCTRTGEDISLFDRSCGPRCTYARVHLYTRLCRLERHRNAKKPFRRFGLIYGFLGHALSYIIILYNTVLSVYIHQAFVRSRFRCV